MTKLVFLISLPRSGSTLLQHILGNHSNIEASAEPWVLFPHLLTLKKNALQGIYNAETGRIAITDFLSQIEGGEDTYFKGIRKYSDYIYTSFLKKSGKAYFLDKTSRYYLALDELYRVYPDAKYIFLTRNPLSVMASFIENMVKGNIEVLGKHLSIRTDLLDGFKIIVENINKSSIESTVIKYESLIDNPGLEIEKLCNFLEVDYEPNMIEYGGTRSIFKGTLVDPKSIHKHNVPVKDYLNTWVKVLDTNEKKKFAFDYLNFLGSETIKKAGYDINELIKKLDVKDFNEHGKFTFKRIMIDQEIQSLKKNNTSTIMWAIRHGHLKLATYRILKPFLSIIKF